MRSPSNVGNVIRDGLCVTCGGCAAACMNDAISVVFNEADGAFDIVLSETHCSSCGRCREVCPICSTMLDHRCSNESRLDCLGPMIRACLAHSSCDVTRFDSSSGGVVTELLKHLLEEHIVDEVCVVAARHSSPFAYGAVLNKAGFSSLSQRDLSSRYVVYPIAQCLKSAESKKLALVGLPCQVHAAKNACAQGGVDLITIGLACSSGVTAKATQQWLMDSGVLKTRQLYYRGNGWPGETCILGMDSLGSDIHLTEEYSRSRFVKIFSTYIFRLPGCWACTDHFGEESDLSVFDFWDKDVIELEKRGVSGVIVRSNRVDAILAEMTETGKLTIVRNLSRGEIEASQAISLKMKKSHAAGRKAANTWALSLHILARLFHLTNSHRRFHSRIFIDTVAFLVAICVSRATYK